MSAYDRRCAVRQVGLLGEDVCLPVGNIFCETRVVFELKEEWTTLLAMIFYKEVSTFEAIRHGKRDYSSNVLEVVIDGHEDGGCECKCSDSHLRYFCFHSGST